MVNIKDLDKAGVLKALWEHSHTQGMSFLGLLGLKDGEFTIEHARELVSSNPSLYFDYVDGHVIKCNISGDEFDERLYDRDCGIGMAQKAIDRLRKEVEMMENPYEYKGPIIELKIVRPKDNDQVAETLHNALKGKEEYKISSGIVLNKDPDITTGNEQTGVYICVDEIKDINGWIDTLANALKSIKDFI